MTSLLGRLRSLNKSRVTLATQWVALTFVGVVILHYAWLGDDIYITLRTIKQWSAGNGLVWNLGQRVQVYTHPLWMFLLAAGHAFTGEFYFTTVFVSVATSLTAVWFLLSRFAAEPAAKLIGAALLGGSAAFIDYSTSGLENPLIHLLSLGVFYQWLKLSEVAEPSAAAQAMSKRKHHFLWISLLASLCAVTRMDTVLVVAPFVVSALFIQLRAQVPVRSLLSQLALAVVPFIAWEAFSLVYYGALVPNTALAKLNTAIPLQEQLKQGMAYYLATVQTDPITLAVIALGFVVACTFRLRYWPLLLNIVAYLLYLLRIGGDFMQGRFFTVPFVLSVAFVLHASSRIPALRWILVATTGLGLVSPQGPISFKQHFPGSPIARSGVANERLAYQRWALSNATSLRWEPNHRWRREGRQAKPGSVHGVGATGLIGVHSDNSVVYIDRYALTDPLLARLPMRYNPHWRIGHFSRAVPLEYVRRSATEAPRFKDSRLQTYYDHIDRVVSGPLWSAARWKSIWILNTTQSSDHIDTNVYRFHGEKNLTWDQVGLSPENRTSKGKGAAAHWKKSGLLITEMGVRRHERYLALHLVKEGSYDLLIFDGQAQQEIRTLWIDKRHRNEFVMVDVGKKLADRGYTSVRLQAHGGKKHGLFQMCVGKTLKEAQACNESHHRSARLRH